MKVFTFYSWIVLFWCPGWWGGFPPRNHSENLADNSPAILQTPFHCSLDEDISTVLGKGRTHRSRSYEQCLQMMLLISSIHLPEKTIMWLHLFSGESEKYGRAHWFWINSYLPLSQEHLFIIVKGWSDVRSLTTQNLNG